MAKKKEPEKSKGGRPLFDGKDINLVLAKLEEVWALGGSDAEAALFADISASSLSRYLDAHPEVAQRRDALRERPVLLARRALIESFDGHEYKATEKVKDAEGREVEKEVTRNAPKCPDLALKYLERRKKDEFSPKSEIDIHNKTLEQVLDEANKKEGEGK